MPVIRLLPALPVPLIAAIPVKVRFSTLAGRVRLRRLCRVSLMVTSPMVALGSRMALTGLERVTKKPSSPSLRLSLRMGILRVAKVILAGMVRVPVLLV